MDASPLSGCQFMKESFPFGLYESMGTEAPAVFLQSLQHWCIKINPGTSGTTSGSEARGETMRYVSLVSSHRLVKHSG